MKRKNTFITVNKIRCLLWAQNKYKINQKKYKIIRLVTLLNTGIFLYLKKLCSILYHIKKKYNIKFNIKLLINMLMTTALQLDKITKKKCILNIGILI